MSTAVGFSRTQLIELADRRTERRGSKTLDLDAEFTLALQDFCMETRWEWRRKIAVFNLTAGVWSYDLTQLTPPIIDLQQMVKHGVKYYPNPGEPKNWAEITPMFEKALQTASIYSNTNFPQPAPPQKYFRVPGVALTLGLVPVPDQPYPITLDYWSVPVLTPDDMGETIPLVPPQLHGVLLKKLEAEIFRYTLGEGAAKFQAAEARYSEMVTRAQLYDAMAPGEQKDYSSDEDYESSWSTGHNAIQSTT